MIPTDSTRRQFASDNWAPICPEAWQAMTRANDGHAPGYGDDRWTARAADLIRDLFQTDCQVFFVFNGTAANSLALASLCQSYHSVICHELSHIETDECGGPEFFSNGTKLLLAPETSGVSGGGKLDPEAVAALVHRRSDIHYPKPRVLSITQSTECGTVYDIDHLTRLTARARGLGLRVHMDGARLANAWAALDHPPRAWTWEAGVDVLCLGGTKSGMAAGEAVVFFDRELAREFAYRCKQAGQLASKMRYLAAPWVGMLETGAYLRHARHANDMAALLESRVADLPGVELLHPRQANAVFLRLPAPVADRLRGDGWHFYNFIGHGGARFMTSWDTQPGDIDALAADLRRACRA